MVGLMSAPVVALVVLSLRTSWESWKVWLEGLLPSLLRVLQLCHTSPPGSSATGADEPLRNRVASRGQGGAGSV